ncbi:MAG: RDD family protein [Dongiaceae bacterium]
MAAVAGMGEPTPAIAGFWRRLAAFLVDVLIVSAALLILGFVLYGWTSSLGQAGRAIGLAAALLYFGLLDSRVAGGGSPGKRLLGLRVVDRSGAPLSPIRAAFRCLVALAPWFVNGLWLGPGGPLAGLLGALQALLLFGLGGALLYLILFNRRTRQSVQDLATDSFVVRAAEDRAPIALRIAPLHLRISGLWILLLLIGGSAAALWPADPAAAARSKPLGELHAALAAELGAGPVGVRLVTTTLTSPLSGSSSTSYLEVTVFRTRPDPRPDGVVILAAAGIVLRQAPDLLGRPLLSVQTVRGFDLGLAWWRIAYRGVYDAAEWRKLLLQFPGTTRSS